MQIHKLVSIVLPTYNGKTFIKQALECCLRQTYAHFELIVVDDHSTDGTDEIVKEYAARDQRVAYWRNETNQQLPASLNKGFSLAKGEYYTWTSDDNLFAENAVEEMVKALDSQDQYSLVYSSYKMINDKNKIIDEYRAVPESLLFGCAVGACFLYKKEIHESLMGYDEQKFRMEDYDFWLRACLRYKFLFIDRPDLYSYRKHKANLSSKIFRDEELFRRYKEDYLRTLTTFFEGIAPGFSKEDIENHVDIFFNNLVQQRNYTVDTSENLQKLQLHFEKLRAIPWEETFFSPARMQAVINNKQNELLVGLVNTLLFENLQLKRQNPRIAKQLNKPLFWYYREYETLPAWYKKAGHIIKILQGNRPVRKSGN
ncbi:MAG TPA: glycosyltransferase [Puia sp.]|jgi:glycosyltransferase involved in cell wall biosynthesis